MKSGYSGPKRLQDHAKSRVLLRAVSSIRRASPLQGEGSGGGTHTVHKENHTEVKGFS